MLTFMIAVAFIATTAALVIIVISGVRGDQARRAAFQIANERRYAEAAIQRQTQQTIEQLFNAARRHQ